MAVSKDDFDKSVAWIHSVHKASDSLDVERWIIGFYKPECKLYFANNPGLDGREAIITTMREMISKLSLMKHDVLHIDVLPDRIYQEANITYTVKADPAQEEIHVKGIAVFHKELADHKMHRFDVYGDFSKLNERIAQFGG